MKIYCVAIDAQIFPLRGEKEWAGQGNTPIIGYSESLPQLYQHACVRTIRKWLARKIYTIDNFSGVKVVIFQHPTEGYYGFLLDIGHIYELDIP